LWLVAKYVTSTDDLTYTPGGLGRAQTGTGSCSADQLATLNSALDHAFRVGIECLKQYSDPSLLLEMMFQFMARDIGFTCGSITSQSGNCAYAKANVNATSLQNPSLPIQITVNNTAGCDFFSLSDYGQAQVLWHEMLHQNFGPHNPNYKSNREFDPVYSCTQLCFGASDADPSLLTKCGCATCLRTSKCDPRCSVFEDCNSNQLGFVCPCPTGPNAGKLFPTCTQCLVTCPSGLGCFGFSTCIALLSGCSSTPLPCP